MTLKVGVALHLSLQLANHKSHRSGFDARQITVLSDFIIAALFFDKKEGITILERVAFLLRLSICINLTIWLIYRYKLNTPNKQSKRKKVRAQTTHKGIYCIFI